jgi:hypothetical protein
MYIQKKVEVNKNDKVGWKRSKDYKQRQLVV